MSRFSRRLGPSLACAVVVLAAGCAGVPGPDAAAPDSAPDLYQALPPPSSPPPVDPTTEAPPSAAPTTTKRPTPTSGPARPREDDSRRASGQGPAAGSGKIDWHPTGGDEFAGSSVDTAAWNLYDSVGGFGNGHRKPEAISQSDGKLRITARGDVSGGMGMRKGQLYGRWEFRARTDAGRGFGSAILLWPDSENWPEDGELDMMEVPDEARSTAHFVVHWGADNNVHGTDVPGDYTQWHTFAMEWLPDRITWYVDGVKKYENTDPAAIPTKPMHITIQLDQGPKDNWIDAPDETTPEELSLEVDWVRIYAAPQP
jgi:beta-glucanase (GH16 family)